MVPVLVIILICVLSRASDAALRVFGGRDADTQEYPYVVRLEMKMMIHKLNTPLEFLSHVCTGSVLTPIWTLTAGHCLNFEVYKSSIQALIPAAKIKFVIRYESKNAYILSTESFSDIIASVKHPAYKLMSRASDGDLVNNDVGLVKTTPIKLPQYGKLSAVEFPSLMGHKAVAMGYGLMQEGELVGNTLALGKSLQALDVLMKACTKDFIKRSLSPIICLSRKCHQTASICQGDSGGPLIHFSGVVGINQMGFAADCLLQTSNAGVSSNLVGIVTPIGPYVQWIADQIKENKVS